LNGADVGPSIFLRRKTGEHDVERLRRRVKPTFEIAASSVGTGVDDLWRRFRLHRKEDRQRVVSAARLLRPGAMLHLNDGTLRIGGILSLPHLGARN
jgi:hypothetical protein